MAIRSLKTGQFSRSALVGNPVIMPGSYESIATVTVGSGGAASVEFTSIPSTYTHLQIRAIVRTNYTSSNNKSISIDNVTETNATNNEMAIIAGLWSNTAAITSIKLTPDSGSFATNSTFTLYGVL